MTDTASQQPAAAHALLVRLTWGNGQEAAYTTWSEPISVVGLVTYQPEPRLEVEATAQTGGAKDEPWTLTMPATLSPMPQLAQPGVFDAVGVDVSEVDPTAETQVPVLLWRGQITQVTVNPKDKPGAIAAEVGGKRAMVQSPLGVESKTACSRVFGDGWCGVDLSQLSQAAVITVVAGRLLVAPGITVPSGRPGYWSYGKVVVDDLPIGIVDGTGGGAGLKLYQQPPPEWAGKTGLFYPGCNKSFASCTAYNNAPRFFGIGAVKPAGSPSLTPR